MAWTYELNKQRYIGPSSYFPLNILGLTFPRILFLNPITWSTNSGLSWSRSKESKSWSFFSSTTGLTKVKHYLYLKNEESNLLILFFSSTSSENPFWGAKALSKYSLGDIWSPSALISCKEKSLTTQ